MDSSALVTGRPRYRLLGLVAVTSPGGAVPRPSPMRLTVLATLLLRANKAVADDQLIAAVWGRSRPREAIRRLYNYVSELRGLLGPGAITRTRSGYQISVAPGELDLQVFRDAVAEARIELQAGEPDEAARRLRAALALWSGPALSGVSEPLIARARPVLEERRLTALEDLFDAELAAGRHIQVVDELRRVVSANPLRERLVGQLIWALHLCGRRSEALSTYAATQRRLVDQLGAQPGRQLRDMQVAILNEEARSPAPPEVDEFPEPAEVAQGLPGLFRSTEMPPDVGGFVGRADVLAVLDRLAAGAGMVLVVSGLAGVGKTALAVHWAYTARERFPDGQVYLNLRSHDPDHEPLAPSTALGQVLHALDVPVQRIPDTVESRAALYRSILADRRILLLLDDANSAGQVLPLLPPSGGVMITSRHQLGDLVTRAGAHLVTLAPMSGQESQSLLRTILGPDRLAEEETSSAQLVRICAGLPLALEIVAGKVVADAKKTISSVATELANGDLLAALAADETNHGTVASGFGTSYRALRPEHQRLFRLLGLIPGQDFTAPVAAALAAAPVSEGTRDLKALAAACMIEEHTHNRYRFHDLVRRYAAEHARIDPLSAAAWSRLTDYYLCAVASTTPRDILDLAYLLEHEEPVCTHPEHQDPGFLAAELTNIAAVAVSAGRRGPYPTAWLLAGYLGVHLRRAGRRVEWMGIAPALLEAAHEQGEAAVLAMLHRDLGARRAGDNPPRPPGG